MDYCALSYDVIRVGLDITPTSGGVQKKYNWENGL